MSLPQTFFLRLPSEALASYYTMTDLCRMYCIPPIKVGDTYPRTVNIFSPGGGFSMNGIQYTDCTTYWETDLGIPPRPNFIEVVTVSGASNSPAYDDAVSFTEALTIAVQIVGAVLQSTNVTIRILIGTSDIGSMADAVNACSSGPGNVLIFTSGVLENDITADTNNNESVFNTFVTTLKGSIFAAAGNNGGVGGIFYPASSPYATACGGTNLKAIAMNLDPTITDPSLIVNTTWVYAQEVPYQQGTGGPSILFAQRNACQSSLPTSYTKIDGSQEDVGSARLVPDVALHASNDCPVQFRCQGQKQYYYGTAIAPCVYGAFYTGLLYCFSGCDVCPWFNKMLYEVACCQMVHPVTQNSDEAVKGNLQWQAKTVNLDADGNVAFDLCSGTGSLVFTMYLNMCYNACAQSFEMNNYPNLYRYIRSKFTLDGNLYVKASSPKV